MIRMCTVSSSARDPQAFCNGTRTMALPGLSVDGWLGLTAEAAVR